jgi:hypothetical protein
LITFFAGIFVPVATIGLAHGILRRSIVWLRIRDRYRVRRRICRHVVRTCVCIGAARISIAHITIDT